MINNYQVSSWWFRTLISLFFTAVSVSIYILVFSIFNTLHAQPLPTNPIYISKNREIISNTQFVFTTLKPDQFNFNDFFTNTAPHLQQFEEDITFYSIQGSINPRVFLTFLEIGSQGVTNRTPLTSNPFGFQNLSFSSQTFEQQIESLTILLQQNYYQRLYSSLPERQISAQNNTVIIESGVNAGTFSLVQTVIDVGLVPLDLFSSLESDNSFVNTYKRLFPQSDPLNSLFDSFTSPEIIQGGSTGETEFIRPFSITAINAPKRFQLPFQKGTSWVFNGVHGFSGFTPPFSSIDFSPTPLFPRYPTSGVFPVFAPHGGVVTKYPPTKRGTESCFLSINHGNGWETTYYHVQNISKNTGDIVVINEPFANLAQTFDQSTCNGGGSTGAHLHFTLKYFGNFISLHGFVFGNHQIVSSQVSQAYDSNCNVMYFQIVDEPLSRVCPFQFVFNDGDPCNLELSSRGTYTCDTNLTSRSKIPNFSRVKYRAPVITLEEGFSTETTSSFEAEN